MVQTSEGAAISDEEAQRKARLFNQYVLPYDKMIFTLVKKYTNNIENVQDNYNEVLANFYRYIETYDSDKPIRTWLHIVLKRYVQEADRKRTRRSNMRNRDHDIDSFSDCICDEMEGGSQVADSDDLVMSYTDDILWALGQLKPQYRRAIVYQAQGFKLKEIAEMEHNVGALESKNIETVKSRLFLARQQLKQYLTRDGKRISQD